MAMTETIPTEQLAVLGTQTATTVIATTIQHQPIVFRFEFCCLKERERRPLPKNRRNFVLSFLYTQVHGLVELKGSPPRVAKAEGEYRARRKQR
jgi:hypothetical protein